MPWPASTAPGTGRHLPRDLVPRPGQQDGLVKRFGPVQGRVCVYRHGQRHAQPSVHVSPLRTALRQTAAASRSTDGDRESAGIGPSSARTRVARAENKRDE